METQRPENAFLNISETAKSRLEVLERERNSPLLLKIQVDSGGCSGFRYIFALEEKRPLEAHERLFADKIVVDDLSLSMIQGSEVDYVEEMIGSTFLLKNNPQATISCGCKASFSIFPKNVNP